MTDTPPRRDWARGLLLLLTIAAFAHVALGLGFKTLWWDESLSLQRAESALLPLLRGVLVIQDGYTQLPTIDQHPFFSFVLQGILVRLAGTSEYSLRFVAAGAATLLVPALYAFGRLFVRRGVIPAAAPLWTAALAAFSPFFLWYGQEARPYSLWALLAVVSTHLLLRSLEPSAHPRRRWFAYLLALGMFLTTHYYAVFLLPLHALLVYLALAARSRRLAVTLAAVLLLAGAVVGGYAVWMVVRQGGGGNFDRVGVGIILPDLVNAFTSGLSVNITRVVWMNALAVLLAVIGAGWAMRSRQAWRSDGWVLAACVLVPVGVLLVGNAITGIYMNARHMSLIGGPWLLLLGTGLAVIGLRARWAPPLLAALLLGGFGYSTFNYYTVPEYQKDDYRAMGEYMAGRMMPGDVILYYPPSSWRIFEYYVPMKPVHDAAAAGVPIAVYGVPRLDPSVDTGEWLAELAKQYRRVWVLKSGTHPYFDLEGKVEQWLRSNLVQVRDTTFFSFSSLHSLLYLTRVPVEETLTPEIPAPAGVTFANTITLAGTGVDRSAWQAGIHSLPLPVTLYWQVQSKPERRAKYVLQLVEETGGAANVLGRVEREPWEGDIPTLFWDPGKTIVEPVEMNHAPLSADPAARHYFTFQMYDAETQEKLPPTQTHGLPVAEDGFTVTIPFPTE